MDAHPARHVLVVGSDPDARVELAAAFDGLADGPPVMHAAATGRDGLVVLKDRRIDLVFVQIEGDGADLRTFAQAASALAPGVPIVALHGGGHGASLDLDAGVVIDAMRVRVSDFLRRPVSSRDLEEVLDRVRGHAPKAARRLGAVATFISNKGGVGKSTVAVNAACCLARRHPGQVLIVDVSLQLGVCSHMLDLEPTATLADALREKERLDEMLLRQMAVSHACGLDLLAAPRGAVEASEIDADGMSRVLHMASRAYEYVIVDTFPLLDGVVMSVLDASDLAFVVLHGTVPGVVGGADLLGVLAQIGVPAERQRIVLNECQPRFAGRLPEPAVAERLGRDIDYAVPFRKGVLTALNRGEPYALSAWRWSTFRREVDAMAADFEAVTAAGRAASADVAAPAAQAAVA